jgi:glycine hydroxymethyltransferase
MLGLDVVDLPYDAAKRAPDDASAAELIYRVRPSLVVLGASYMPELYAFEHIRAAATSVGALILYDIAHVAGLIAGGRAPNPLDLGADLITLSTYKSLGGPPGAIIAGRDSELETRVRQVAYPGLTSNYDASRVAALAISLNEMTVHGEAYASAMLTNARALERALLSEGLRIIPSSTHHIGIPVGTEGDARSAVDTLRACGLLSGVTAMSGDVSHGLRLGTQLITRRGFTPDDMVVLAQFIGAALRGGQTDDIRRRVMKFARLRSDLHFCT